jgi:16S rRNA processing protein RimM
LNSLSRWIALAQVTKPHGIRGEVKLRVFNEDSDLLLELDEVLLRLTDGQEHEVSIDAVRKVPGGILVKFYSVDDRDRADDIRGAEVCAKREDFPKLDTGEFYACDVIGLPGLLEGAAVGTILDYRSYPSVDIFVLKTDKGTYEVPNVHAYIARVDSDGVHLNTLEELEPS